MSIEFELSLGNENREMNLHTFRFLLVLMYGVSGFDAPSQFKPPAGVRRVLTTCLGADSGGPGSAMGSEMSFYDATTATPT